MSEFNDLDGEKYVVRVIRGDQVFTLSSPKPSIEECRAIIKGSMNALVSNQNRKYMICKINYEEIERT